MNEIKQLGWLGIILAIGIFLAGLGTGAMLRNGSTPAAHGATPPTVAPRIVEVAPPGIVAKVERLETQVSDLTRVVQAVDKLGDRIGSIADSLQRIEAKLDERPRGKRR